MRLLHTSDWHIGRQFHNVSLLDDQQHVLDQLLGYIETEAVDALVIAGDIYDRSVPPAAAVALLDRVLNRVCAELNVPVILIPGNHDGAERLRFGARQLQRAGLHIIGDFEQMLTPVILSDSDSGDENEGKGEVHLYGIPYNDPAMVRDHFDADVSSHDDAHRLLLEKLTEQVDHHLQQNDSKAIANVVISHCFIDGAQESESERPLSIGGADRVSYQHFEPFDYVALGHLHSPQYKGKEHIRYSGSILKYSFGEQHQRKGVTLVDIDSSGLQSTRHLPLTPLRDMRIVEGDLEALLQQGKLDPNSDDYLLVRLTDRHAILDPMGKLRTVYPNVLHLEKPGMLEAGDPQLKREQLKRSELEMFRDFFTQVSGHDLTAEQDQALIQTLTELHRADAPADQLAPTTLPTSASSATSTNRPEVDA
ncbi:MAG: exonuclease SbcCD subunit D [Motiliproteus sp.]